MIKKVSKSVLPKSQKAKKQKQKAGNSLPAGGSKVKKPKKRKAKGPAGHSAVKAHHHRARDLAAAAQISEAAIVKAVGAGLLVRGKDKKFDLRDPVNQDWLINHGLTLDGSPAMAPDPSAAGTDFTKMCGLPECLQNMTIRELVLKHGTQLPRIWTDIFARLMAAAKTDVEIRSRRLDVIPKDFVKHYVGKYLQTLGTKLDAFSNNSISEIMAEVQADPKKARISLPEKMRKELGKLIRESKQTVASNLKKLKGEFKNLNRGKSPI